MNRPHSAHGWLTPVEFVEAWLNQQQLVLAQRIGSTSGIPSRWVRTVREECLDWTLVLGRHHLDAILRDYVRHYNQHRPHRGLRLQVPAPVSAMTSAPPAFSDVGRRDVLGGLIHEYHAAA
jgi:putative transposase